MNIKSILFATLLLSMSLLLYELTLIRIFSVILFYHYAFMAISVAMLGLASSGLAVHFFPDRFLSENVTNWSSSGSGWYSISIIITSWIVFQIPINPYLPPSVEATKLLILYILTTIPFFFAGLVISGLFASLSVHIGKLYSYDLIGAGLGALLIIPLFNLTGGENAVLWIAALGSLSSVLYATGKQKRKYVVLTGFVLIVLLSNSSMGWLKIQYSKGKLISEIEILYNRWNSFSRVMAVPFKPGTDAAYTWCPSPNFPLPVLDQKSIMIDDGASSPVLPFDGRNLEPIEYLKYDLTALPHRLKGNGSTLIVGCGGGRDVLTGLLFNAQHIDAVDINPLVFEVVNDYLGDFTGRLYDHLFVTPIVADGRTFVGKNPDTYDLLQVSMIDTWAATTAGAYSLSENNLYTVEAFISFMNALKKDGILSFTRFYFYPPRESLRLVSIFLEAADRMGIKNARDCMLIGYYENLATLMFKKIPFTTDEIATFKSDLKTLGFNLAYAPYYEEGEAGDRFIQILINIPRERRIEYYSKYPFDVSPSTDDKPFFFNLLKLKDFFRAKEINEGQKFNYYATNTLVTVLLISIFITLLVLSVPLLLRRDSLNSTMPDLSFGFYFLCIGLGYLAIESVLIQRFILLLEHPSLAASGVVAGMLISSGLGSMVWGNTKAGSRPGLFAISFITITIVLLFHVLFGKIIIQNTLHSNMLTKLIISLFLILPLGFVMGIPLPAGITAIVHEKSGSVAWNWAVNGAASVVASPLAVLIALVSGYRSVLILGLICYFCAFLLIRNSFLPIYFGKSIKNG